MVGTPAGAWAGADAGAGADATLGEVALDTALDTENRPTGVSDGEYEFCDALRLCALSSLIGLGNQSGAIDDRRDTVIRAEPELLR